MTDFKQGDKVLVRITVGGDEAHGFRAALNYGEDNDCVYCPLEATEEAAICYARQRAAALGLEVVE